jgi:hypothetical protein
MDQVFISVINCIWVKKEFLYSGGEDDGFFGSDDVGEQEYMEISSADVFNRPGPFDDLFVGDGDLLMQARSRTSKARASRGGSKGGKSRAGLKNKTSSGRRNTDGLVMSDNGAHDGGGPESS